MDDIPESLRRLLGCESDREKEEHEPMNRFWRSQSSLQQLQAEYMQLKSTRYIKVTLLVKEQQ